MYYVSIVRARTQIDVSASKSLGREIINEYPVHGVCPCRGLDRIGVKLKRHITYAFHMGVLDLLVDLNPVSNFRFWLIDVFAAFDLLWRVRRDRA